MPLGKAPYRGLRATVYRQLTTANVTVHTPESNEGAGFIPDVLNVAILDDLVPVADEDAFETARQLARREGLMCGMSAGAAAWAAVQLARRAENKGRLIVVILPDLGERYLSSTLFAE